MSKRGRGFQSAAEAVAASGGAGEPAAPRVTYRALKAKFDGQKRLSIRGSVLALEEQFSALAKRLIAESADASSVVGTVPVMLDTQEQDALLDLAAQLFALDPYAIKTDQYLAEKTSKRREGAPADEATQSIMAFQGGLFSMYTRFFRGLGETFYLQGGVEQDPAALLAQLNTQIDTYAEQAKKQFGTGVTKTKPGKRVQSLAAAAAEKLALDQAEHERMIGRALVLSSHQGVLSGLQWLGTDAVRTDVDRFARMMLLNKMVSFTRGHSTISTGERNKAFVEGLVFPLSDLESADAWTQRQALVCGVKERKGYSKREYGGDSKVRRVAQLFQELSATQLLAKQLCDGMASILSDDVTNRTHTRDMAHLLTAWRACVEVMENHLDELTQTPYYEAWFGLSLKAHNKVKRRRGRDGVKYITPDSASGVWLDDYSGRKVYFDLAASGVSARAYERAHELPIKDPAHCALRQMYATLGYQKALIPHVEGWLAARAEDSRLGVIEEARWEGHVDSALRQVVFLLSDDSSRREESPFRGLGEAFKRAGAGVDLARCDAERVKLAAELEQAVSEMNRAMTARMNLEEQEARDKRKREELRQRYCAILLDALSEAAGMAVRDVTVAGGDPSVTFYPDSCWSVRALDLTKGKLMGAVTELRERGVEVRLFSEPAAVASAAADADADVDVASPSILPPETTYAYEIIGSERVLRRAFSRHVCSRATADDKWRKVSFGLRLLEQTQDPAAKADLLLDILDVVATHRARGYHDSHTKSFQAMLRWLLRSEPYMRLLADRSRELCAQTETGSFLFDHFNRFARSRRSLQDRLAPVLAVGDVRRVQHRDIRRAGRWLRLLIEVKYRLDQDAGRRSVNEQTGRFFSNTRSQWRTNALEDRYNAELEADL